MKFSLSTNIKTVQFSDFQYIPTSNSRRVLGSLVADYSSGIHCFTLVGTYGTGKSSFIAALERDLLSNTKTLFDNKGQFNNYKKSLVSTKKSQKFFEIIEIQFVRCDFGAQRFEITFTV